MTDQERVVQRFKGQFLQTDKIASQKARRGTELPAIAYRFKAGYTSRKLGAYGDK